MVRERRSVKMMSSIRPHERRPLDVNLNWGAFEEEEEEEEAGEEEEEEERKKSRYVLIKSGEREKEEILIKPLIKTNHRD